MSLVILPRARVDGLEHAVYLGEQQEDLEDAFLAELDHAYDTLRNHPEIGGKLESKRRGMKDVRAWPLRRFKNHIIYYRVQGGEVWILRVLHGARDIEKHLSNPYFP